MLIVLVSKNCLRKTYDLSLENYVTSVGFYFFEDWLVSGGYF